MKSRCFEVKDAASVGGGGGAAGGEEDGEVLLQPLGLSGLVLQHTHCLSN